MTKTAGLNRLFNPQSRRCFDVAIDHGFFNEPSFLQGIENIRRTIDILCDPNPDAIQLTVGQATIAELSRQSQTVAGAALRRGERLWARVAEDRL